MFGWFGVPLLRKAPRSNHSMGCRTPRAWIEPLALPPGRNLPSPWGEQLFHGGNDENLWLTLLPLFCERRNANMETIKSTGNSMNFALHTGHTVLKHLHIYIYTYIYIYIYTPWKTLHRWPHHRLMKRPAQRNQVVACQGWRQIERMEVSD